MCGDFMLQVALSGKTVKSFGFDKTQSASSAPGTIRADVRLSAARQLVWVRPPIQN
jgi:hypothetical protein